MYNFLIGGSEPGLAALTRFYSWHIFGLTLAAAGVGAWHIFKVRRDGGISSPPPPRGEILEKVPRAALVKKEVLAMLITGGYSAPAIHDHSRTNRRPITRWQGNDRGFAGSLVFPLDPTNIKVG